jgi:hypothetical protein
VMIAQVCDYTKNHWVIQKGKFYGMQIVFQ